ncbi:MAG: glucose-1-phosphate cytidylyltransferase [Spirochaetes bacterium]|nr:glucose-1-phosphate cytidylyltransferase [Spirochaetota bacterium]
MKVVLLAGGMGTRISEETSIRPKPMVEVGGKPILWHIMKIYSSYGYNEFVVCLGYKGYFIKEYFSNYFLHQADVTVDLAKNITEYHTSKAEPWRVTLIDTGAETMTGGRIKRIQQYIGDEAFMMTYGDGVADINIRELVASHQKSGCTATITAVQPSGRFGVLNIGQDNKVNSFQEKPRGDGSWINGGFFVLEPSIFKLLHDDAIAWEREPLESIAKQGQLNAYHHHGFWKPMDTLRDKNELDELWRTNSAPWKIW